MKSGKYVTVNPRNPTGVGVCDITGMTVSHKDLCKQYEWYGDQLAWTGLMVYKDFLDTPNEAWRPPKVKGDPKPLENPRPPQNASSPVFNPNFYQELLNADFIELGKTY